MRVALAGDLLTLPTGYAKQTYEFGRRLVARGHEVANFALQHFGPVRDVEGVEVYGYSKEELQKDAHERFRPDVTVHLRDNWTMTDEGSPDPYHPRRMAHRFNGKFLAYTPVDSDYYPKFLVDSIATEGDLTAVNTDWAIEVLTGLGADAARLRRLYDGIDRATYRPGPRDPELLRNLGLPEDVPIFLQVGTNWQTMRKMQPLTLLAFKSYVDRYDSDALLYIHSPIAGYFRLDECVKMVGLWGKGRVGLRLAGHQGGHFIGRTEAEMAALYNSSSALINLSFAEGFDRPAAEAASCGLPTVVTDFPVHREVLGLWKGRSTPFYVPSKQVLPQPASLGWLADHEAAADMLDKALHTPKGEGGVPKGLGYDELTTELEAVLHELVP